jgi:hypothetical protein
MTIIQTSLTSVQVLVSFYFGALAVLLIVLWGYFTGSLPADLIHRGDYYTIGTVKTFFGRPEPVLLDGNQLPPQSQKQRKRSRAIVAFLGALSDQQLITGLAILIAAWSNRCYLSVHELRIVTSLAYFSATSHALCLDVLRSHFYLHVWARHCRALFTIVFLVLFVFTYVVTNSVFWGIEFSVTARSPKGTNSGFDSGTIVQCLFLRPKALQVYAGDFAIVMAPMVIVVGKYTSAIFRLYVAPPGFNASKGYSTGRAMDRVAGYLIRYKMGISWPDFDKIIYKAGANYDDDLRTKASRWHIVETYLEAYLSRVPIWIFQFAYGTKSTGDAVWNSEVEVSDELNAMSFGQVVALGLLLLPFLAFVQILNGVSVQQQHEYEVPEEQKPSNEEARPDSILHPQPGQLEDRLASIASALPNTQLNLEEAGLVHSNRIPATVRDPSTAIDTVSSTVEDKSHSTSAGPKSQRTRTVTANSIGTTCIVICTILTGLLVFVATMRTYVADLTVLGFLGVVSAAFKLKRFIRITRLVGAECEARKQQNMRLSTMTPAPAASSSGPASVTVFSSAVVATGSIAASDTQPRNAAVSGMSLDDDFAPPRRQDTEADIGLVPLRRRRTDGV